MKTIIIMLLVFPLCIPACNEYPGKPLGIGNNSDHRIYYWYAHWSNYDLSTQYHYNYTDYHYPDTILPKERPAVLNFVNSHEIADTGGECKIPIWEKIFSELPNGKFSVYFFKEYPEIQEEWDSIRNNNAYYRKDVTYQEFVDNDYNIYYP
jgi:hypothetical protein